MSFFETVILILSPILGLVIGSFLNALIYRTEKELTLFGRSFCPKCKKQIAWQDNIPLLSFLFLKGKCRHCHKKISWQYPFVEATTGFAFFMTAYFVLKNYFNDFLSHFFNLTGILSFEKSLSSGVSLIQQTDFLLKIFELIFLFIIISVFVAIFVYDFKHLLIPDAYIFFGLVTTLIYNLFSDFFLLASVFVKSNSNLLLIVKDFALRSQAPRGFFLDFAALLAMPQRNFGEKIIQLKAAFSSSGPVFFVDDSFFSQPFWSLIFESRLGSGIIAGLLFAGFFYLFVFFSKETWMGMGDVKLAFLLGLFLGSAKTLFGAFLAFQIGATVGITLMILGRAKMKTALPFGPFLILGAVISLFFT